MATIHYEGLDGWWKSASFWGILSTAIAIRVSAEVAAPADAAAPVDAAAPAADAAKPAGPLKSADGETILSGSGKQINLQLAGKGAQNCKG